MIIIIIIMIIIIIIVVVLLIIVIINSMNTLWLAKVGEVRESSPLGTAAPEALVRGSSHVI